VKGVFDERQFAHAPSRFLSRGEIVAYPEAPERARRLLAGATAAGLEFVAPGPLEASALASVHTGRYLRFLQTAHEEWRKLPGAGPEVTASVRPVERPARYPAEVLGRAGWHMMDFSCAITADTWPAIAASAATAATATGLVTAGERAAYALCRPPGHHAYPDRGSGFCYVNNSALAATLLCAHHERVAILDIDVHHGNGTQGVFYDRADVFTVSIHADPRAYYPFFYGHAGETGRGAGRGFNLNDPVPVKSGDAVWMAALDQALSGFAAMAARIASLRLPTVIVQEGGYLTEHLSGNLTAFLDGFSA
jgi:acetoin utilization deacetylase AcuC-like enzyme